jgi:hypothetical protein
LGAERKLVELAKLHPFLKEKGRLSFVTVSRGGRANTRSQLFKDDTANEQKEHWNSGEENFQKVISYRTTNIFEQKYK